MLGLRLRVRVSASAGPQCLGLVRVGSESRADGPVPRRPTATVPPVVAMHPSCIAIVRPYCLHSVLIMIIVACNLNAIGFPGPGPATEQSDGGPFYNHNELTQEL